MNRCVLPRTSASTHPSAGGYAHSINASHVAGPNGRVWQIVRIKSLNPVALKKSIGLYATLMKGPSPLMRAQREMLAVVVSKANDCHY